MSGLTLVFSIFFYIAIDIFIIGMLLKVWKYVSTPAPLKIPQTPAPKTAAGVGVRMFKDVVFFRSLFRGNKRIWLGGYLFHLALLIVFMKHLRFFLPATPAIIDDLVDIDIYTGFVVVGALAFLFILRLAVDRHFFISVFNDYMLLVFIIAIGTTGLLSRFWEGGGVRSDIPYIKEFVGGLFTFHPGTVPENPLFLTHFSLVMLFLMYFPFSKMVHAVAIFFSPTRNQIDNSREKRWGPWMVKGKRYGQVTPPAAASVLVKDEPTDA
ncbi:MAG: nitrate reductase [Gaiellales bacterium]|nr:MAG: nitrate reductase [Gaiellales bacterium]